MDNYKFTVITRDGEKISGVIEGANEMDAASRLKESYPIVVNIAPVQEDSKTAKFLKSDINGNKLNNKAFTLMCSQFAVILKAGSPGNYLLALGFTLFSLASVSWKLKGKINAFPLLKLAAYLLILFILLRGSSRQLFF